MKKGYSILATTLLIASSALTSFANTGNVDNSTLTTNELNQNNIEVKTETAFINANGVRMRTGPGTSYSVIRTLNKNTMVHKTGKVEYANGDFWCSIQHNGTHGWVVMDYLE